MPRRAAVRFAGYGGRGDHGDVRGARARRDRSRLSRGRFSVILARVCSRVFRSGRACGSIWRKPASRITFAAEFYTFTIRRKSHISNWTLISSWAIAS